MEEEEPVLIEEFYLNMANIEDSKEVCKYYLEGKCRFGEDCLNKHEGEPLLTQKKKSRPPPMLEKEDTKNKKKSPMKTASDVIKRLQWDSSLNSNFFTLGYVDRFLGVMEKPFSEFCWEDLASVDDTEVFAIPQHRIQYFKYRGEKVWDKPSRLDLVFGSAGVDASNLEGIHAFMSEVDAKKLTEEAEGSSDYSSDSDSDLEDSPIRINYDPKARISDLKVQEEDRSTHFIAIHVKVPDIISGISEVQSSLRREEELLSECCMDSRLIHLTLDMLRLNGPEGVREAIDLLQSVKEAIDGLPKINLKLEGIGTFGQRVLYAKVSPDNPINFDQLRSIILSALLHGSSHVKSTNKFDYVPHVTMAKISRPIARLRHSKYIPGSYYSQFIDKSFGTFQIDNVKLCVIEDDRGPDGFYKTLSTIEF